jgi:hypothetical protein
MGINIKWGLKFEINRVKGTLEKLEWYKENGYKPLLPEIKDNDTIEDSIKNEFDEKFYKKMEDEIRKEYEFIEIKFSDFLKNKFNLKILPNFNIVLTKYGVGGSYKLPDTIIVNIWGNQINKPLIEVIKHEIVHLMVEEDVIKKKLPHCEKEKLVTSIADEFNFQ